MALCRQSLTFSDVNVAWNQIVVDVKVWCVSILGSVLGVNKQTESQIFSSSAVRILHRAQ